MPYTEAFIGVCARLDPNIKGKQSHAETHRRREAAQFARCGGTANQAPEPNLQLFLMDRTVGQGTQHKQPELYHVYAQFSAAADR
jgi:hypothetical protein